MGLWDDIKDVASDIGENLKGFGESAEEWLGGAEGFSLGVGLVSDYFTSAIERSEDIDEYRGTVEDTETALEDAYEEGQRIGRQLEEAYTDTVEGAEKGYNIAVTQAEQIKEQALDAAEQKFWELTQENIAGSGETRRQFNRQVLSRMMEGEISRGEAAAELAQGNVRRTGSASNLISESVRMFDVDVAEIDRQLDAEMAKYGRERGRFRTARKREERSAELTEQQAIERAAFARNEAIKKAGRTFEHGLENLLGEDIDLGSYLTWKDYEGPKPRGRFGAGRSADGGVVTTPQYTSARTLEEFLGAEWYTDTLLTRDLERGLEDLYEEGAEYYDSGWDIVKNMWGSWLDEVF